MDERELREIINGEKKKMEKVARCFPGITTGGTVNIILAGGS